VTARHGEPLERYEIKARITYLDGQNVETGTEVKSWTRDSYTGIKGLYRTMKRRIGVKTNEPFRIDEIIGVYQRTVLEIELDDLDSDNED
jgi:hypothetical protein